MYSMEMCEGYDRPRQLPVEKVEHEKTGGKLMCICPPLYGCGIIVIMDSGSCVLKALLSSSIDHDKSMAMQFIRP